MRRGLATAALLLALSGCATAPPSATSMASACRAPLKAMTQVDLYFGRNIPTGGEVSDAQWRQFLDEVVTPRFPDGLSVLDVYGQYKSARTGTIARERSKRLSVIVPDAAVSAAQFEAIKAAYKQRFSQESVLQAEAGVCAQF